MASLKGEMCYLCDLKSGERWKCRVVVFWVVVHSGF